MRLTPLRSAPSPLIVSPRRQKRRQCGAPRDHLLAALPGAADIARAAEIMAAAPDVYPESLIGLSGDKRFFFSEDGSVVVPYTVMAGMAVGLGAPVAMTGNVAFAAETFRFFAAERRLSAAFYAVPPTHREAVEAAGFVSEKIGENAVVDLATFSLSGRKREVIRRGHRKLAERGGATFALHAPPHADGLIEEVRGVSDAWLDQRRGREKGFSVGRFSPEFLGCYPLAVARLGGEAAAFATILPSREGERAGIDLMRFHPERQSTNTMDFLIVEILLALKAKGFAAFDLSMVPLAGLDDDRSRLLPTLGHAIYSRGERFYNFGGLRRFKAKFDPVWEPRYLSAPTRALIPGALARVALATNRSPR